MTIGVLAFVMEGYHPLYMIDLKKFNAKTQQIEIDGYMEIQHDEGFNDTNQVIVLDYQESIHHNINRDFVIRAKREKTEEWNSFKYKFYRIDE